MTLLTARTEVVDPAVLGFWAEVLDFVNNSLIPGEEGCQQPRTGGHRRFGG